MWMPYGSKSHMVSLIKITIISQCMSLLLGCLETSGARVDEERSHHHLDCPIQ